MDTRKLYNAAYRLQRQGEEESDELTKFLYMASLLGLVENPDHQTRVLEAAAESYDNRNVCDPYSDWMNDARKLVAEYRLFSPIGQAFLALLGGLTPKSEG